MAEQWRRQLLGSMAQASYVCGQRYGKDISQRRFQQQLRQFQQQLQQLRQFQQQLQQLRQFQQLQQL